MLPKLPPKLPPELTKAELERLRDLSEAGERLAADPLGRVPDGPLPARERAAFFAAGLAFGNVAAIRRVVGQVLAHLDDPEALRRLAGHRWVRGPDLAAVATRVRALQAEHGSLGAAFGAGYEPGKLRQALAAFSDRLRRGLPATRGVHFMTSTPATGGACKRMNLLLRWMVRRDEPDLGIWQGVRCEDLIVPLDVHVVRFAHRYNLTTRKTVSWRMAEEVTRALARFSPGDPLRYDFAISHYGMVYGWGS